MDLLKTHPEMINVLENRVIKHFVPSKTRLYHTQEGLAGDKVIISLPGDCFNKEKTHKLPLKWKTGLVRRRQSKG